MLSRAPLLMILATFFASSLAHAATSEVRILDAIVKDKNIEGATIILQKNGEASVTASTNSAGRAKISAPFPTSGSDVILIAKKDGYSNLVVRCPCDGLTYAMSPVQKSLDGLRIVLNWGDKPDDLDSHLVYEDQHVYYSRKKGTDSNLDVDDTDSYGPETITLEKKHAGSKYVYAVHNYSEGDKTSSSTLSDVSRAKVFVYIGSSLVRTFTPPPNKKGNGWIVFGIGEDGEFYDINTFMDLKSRELFKTKLRELIAGGQWVSNPYTTSDSLTQADRVNREGEKAYHAKRLEEAVRLYQEAINLNPEHSQAYSNLGLAFQKLGNRAEAIWANRKAIALATGSNAATVKASSYFNIARVLEEQEQWTDALKAFEEAQKFKKNDAYTKGIERMKKKMAQ